jgi:hypothetical protein
LDVLLLWLVLWVVALSIADDLQPPGHGLHEVHQALSPFKNLGQNMILQTSLQVFIIGLAIMHLFMKFL